MKPILRGYLTKLKINYIKLKNICSRRAKQRRRGDRDAQGRCWRAPASCCTCTHMSSSCTMHRRRPTRSRWAHRKTQMGSRGLRQPKWTRAREATATIRQNITGKDGEAHKGVAAGVDHGLGEDSGLDPRKTT